MHNKRKNRTRSLRVKGGQPAFPRELTDLAARMAARRMPLPLKDDATFKMFLSGPSPESNACLRSILSAMTGRKVTTARVKNSELVPETPKGKMSRLDVNCEFNDGQKADIELQLTKADDDQKLRALFYACKLYAGSLKKGKLYKTAPSVYQIFLIDFDLFGEDEEPGGRKFYHRAMMRLDDGSVFADRLQILFFDLEVPGEVQKGLKNAANWCKFIDGCTDPGVLEKLGKDEGWKEEYKMALKAYMRIAAEERAWAYHLSTDRAEADYRNGLILAEEKGERKRALSSARNMLADGLPTEKISRYTGLPLEDVEGLASERV
jgi:predicted transposase/invertase (TIGR01784 family)